MSDAREPESQEEILAAWEASLTEDDIPPEDAERCWPDPDCGMPLELALLPDAELAALDEAAPARPAWPVSPMWSVPAALPVPPSCFGAPAVSSAWPSSLGSPGSPGSPGVQTLSPGSPDELGGWPLSYRAAGGLGGWPWPAGFAVRDGSGNGCGFADGGVLDTLPAGIALAEFTADAHARAADLDDDSLIGVMRAWRRLASWAQAGELATVAELARRRPADGHPPAASPGEFPTVLSEFVDAEVAVALTLTNQAARTELGLALDLADRPATAAALETGQIDLARATIITRMICPLSAEHADAVEAEVLPRGGEMTTGQLRAALLRAVLAVDPQAARRRREEAEKEARVEHWADPEGTATLTGRYLPPAEVLAASKRLCQIAALWKRQGAQGGMDLLRARAYLALLNGQSIDTPPASLLPPPEALPPEAPSPEAQAPGNHSQTAGSVPGLVNLTVPLATLLRLGDAPGEVAGYGPLDADSARVLACAVAGHGATRWQITVTAPGGEALATGIARGRARAISRERGGTARDGGGWMVRVTAEPVATGHCDHRNCEPGYRPSPALQRLVRARSGACSFPCCRRPAARCDLDHSVPYDDGGISCECNLAPLCRFHHRVKQAEGWKLEHNRPGVMVWITPAGRRYTTLASRHPT
jgi:hypothetical protein